jgi:hypothetical protein
MPTAKYKISTNLKTKIMTIAELKQKLNEFDENLEIAGSGHFGERLDIYDPYLCNEGFVVCEIESAGEEPD